MGNKGMLSELLLRNGEVIKRNVFETERGEYTIRIIKLDDGKLYFHKMKDGETVEIKRLN